MSSAPFGAALDEAPGDILAFLPGMGEILPQPRPRLRGSQSTVLPLHG